MIGGKRRRTHEEFMEKLDEVSPDREWEIIGKYTFNRDPILVSTKYGDCMLTPNQLLNLKNKPSIRSAVDKTAYTIARFEEKHGKEKFDYSEFEYSGTRSKSKIICKKAGHEFEMDPNGHLSGRGCEACYREATSKRLQYTSEDFVKVAIERHGQVYDYSKVKYVDARTQVIITCDLHGEFSQVPYYHTSGNGCPECSKGSNSKERFLDLCHKRVPKIYLIRVYKGEEEFYKIGITSRTSKSRFKTSRSLPYDYEVVDEIEGKCPGEVFDTEQRILKNFREFSYEPTLFFKGHTECFNSKLPVEEVLTELKKLKNNKHGTK